MKQFLKKPLGLAVSATMAMAGLAAFSSAHALTDATALGDAAIVPYYTVQGNYITGIQVINTSAKTVVAKVRLRRDTDSADVLDFNVILSPHDVWNGYVDDSAGSLRFSTSDTTCTAPLNTGTLLAPTDAQGGNLTGAEEGYIEIIGMAQAADVVAPGDSETQVVPVAAKHVAGTPRNCAAVESNFLNANVTTNILTATAGGKVAAAGAVRTAFNTSANTAWENVDNNALKVSYFIRDASTGMEFGDNATHLKDFSTVSMMTGQENGLNSGQTSGFDFPDLDGGGSNAVLTDAGVATAPADTGAANARATATGSYDSIVRADLGATTILNNWSYNTSNNVATDWVITIPGQYLMRDPEWVPTGPADVTGINTDLPVNATLVMYDREETKKAGGSIVVSPGVGVAGLNLNNEVNVIQWGGKSVFNADSTNVTSADPAASGITQQFGWATLSLTSAANLGAKDDGGAARTGLRIYDPTEANIPNGTYDAVSLFTPATNVPVIGFAAWQRSFSSAAKNYGRIIGHSRY